MPELVSVKLCVTETTPTVTEPKLAEAGASIGTAAGGGVPVPDKPLLNELAPAITVNNPLKGCTAVGANVTLIWQLEFAATPAPQLEL